jgi:hypothetical protein
MKPSVRVQAAALIARTSTGCVGESAAGFLDEEHPRRVIPNVAALGQEGVDSATNELDRRNGSRRCPSRSCRQASSGHVVDSTEQGIGERRRRADLESPRPGLVAWPGRFEGTATSGRPPTASQRRRGDERDLRGPVNVQSNLHSPVRITPTEERGAIDRIEYPDPIGFADSTEFLAQERIFRPRLRQRLPKQALDRPIGFGDRCAVDLQRCRNARLEEGEREFRRQGRCVERELEVRSTVHAADASHRAPPSECRYSPARPVRQSCRSMVATPTRRRVLSRTRSSRSIKSRRDAATRSA